MQEQNQKFQRIKTPLDKRKLKVHGERWEGEYAGMPSGYFRVVNNNVRFEAWGNHPSEQNGPLARKPYVCRMDPIICGTFLEMFKEVVRSKDEVVYDVPNFTPSSNEPNAPLIEDASMAVGRDSNGEIFIGISIPDRPKLKFPFKHTRWYDLRRNGKPLERWQSSNFIARSFLNTIQPMINTVLVTEHVDEDELRAALEKRRAEEAAATSQNSFNSDPMDY